VNIKAEVNNHFFQRKQHTTDGKVHWYNQGFLNH